MKDVKRASETFDKIADHFDQTRNKPWKEVENFIKSCHGKIIDLGCGNGRHSLSALNSGLDFVCLDASVKLLNIAKLKTKNKGYYTRSGLKKLPFKNCSFDNAIYIAAVHHLSSGRIESLKEVKRILKENGRVLVSAWAREQDRWNLEGDESDVIVPWHKNNGEVIERYYHLYTLDELARDIKKSGLKIIRKYRVKGNNYVEAKKTN